MKELNLTLTVNELNLILESLSHESYIKVFALIENIQNQAKQQLNGSAPSLGLNSEKNTRQTLASEIHAG